MVRFRATSKSDLLTNAQAKGDIEPHTLTLRFKHGKHTILLFIDPLSTFAAIKTELLTVLRERYPSGLSTSLSPTPIKIPDSQIDVIFGVPVDVYEPQKGWSEIDTSGGAAMRESPKSLGLKDGSVVAFAFVGEDQEETPEFHVEFSNVDELYPDEAE